MSNEKPGATGQFPEGKIGEDDEGELLVQIAYDAEHGLIRVEFGKPVAWLMLKPQDSVDLGKMLVEHGYAAGGKVMP